ncbi:hypothetical protein BXU11_05070 [Flavobacterium sp. LM5]|uniref:FkbM family methyltransferase n=1 Tax=Flavobacterium sp. LM5 TaxID=1938610 RepID=UPI0009940C77|nr:FkbM family methyltransferase [Flavobacterium sp. LM5]OOV29291.1 hypothetical protein BXU11_05070 [Flavobacterium sp. LM5]
MKLRKLRKIYRILFPLQQTEKQIFVNRLVSNSIVESIKQVVENCYQVKLQNGLVLYVRDENHSDFSVFQQIFNFEEYKTVLSLLKLNDTSGSAVLIDCGANVGYTTTYFTQNYHFSKIFCIEPSLSNIEILKKNIDKLENADTINIMHRAISGNINENFDVTSDFRDGLDWSFSTSANKNGTVKGITINEIVSENNLDIITLLKIDIEGAERFIFDDNVDLSFLSITKIIAVEVHDEFQIRDKIYSILKKYDFILFETGELTIGIKSKML